ncbi:MAG: Na(+)-translocating NADH-quinone reductase subunit A [Bacteroidota bacterium]
MSKTIKLKKGFDINLKGKAEKMIGDTVIAETYALKPTDFPSITRPKLLVKEGDNVKAGTPVFFDKMMEDVYYCSPVSGEIAEIKRGAKRKLLEVVILADKQVEFESLKKWDNSSLKQAEKKDLIEALTKGGVWPHIIQRPYGIVANPEDEPLNIYISGFDSHPLAPDYGFALKDDKESFQAGLSVLAKLTAGKVHLNLNADGEVSQLYQGLNDVEINHFQGAHPVGNVGVQIHHLKPINKGDIVWTVSPIGVVEIGRLISQGQYNTEKLISVAGSEVKSPKYMKIYAGTAIKKVVEGNIEGDHVRYISGNPLTGEKIALEGYLGFYHNQISVIPEGDYHEMFGWILPSAKKLSFQRAFGLLSFLNGKNKEYELDTNTRGEKRAFVQTGVFEKVTPMDILPVHLLKAIMAEDYDEMEALGIYEVIEEDLALCEFVDVSKHDVQKIVREGLDLIRIG